MWIYRRWELYRQRLGMCSNLCKGSSLAKPPSLWLRPQMPTPQHILRWTTSSTPLLILLTRRTSKCPFGPRVVSSVYGPVTVPLSSLLAGNYFPGAEIGRKCKYGWQKLPERKMDKLRTTLKLVKVWIVALSIIIFHFILLCENFFHFPYFSWRERRVKFPKWPQILHLGNFIIYTAWKICQNC